MPATKTGSRKRRKGGRRGGPRRWRSWRVPAWAVLAIVLVTALVTWLVTRPSSFERQVAELEAQAAANDVHRTGELLDATAGVLPEVQGLLDEMHAHLPPPDESSDQPIDGLASAEDIAAWQGEAATVVEQLDAVGSAGTGVNMARNGLVAAARQLATTVELYEFALTLEPEQAVAMLPLIQESRRAVAETWGTAAIQVDLISIDNGFGHSHMYLSLVPGGPPPEPGH